MSSSESAPRMCAANLQDKLGGIWAIEAQGRLKYPDVPRMLWQDPAEAV